MAKKLIGRFMQMVVFTVSSLTGLIPWGEPQCSVSLDLFFQTMSGCPENNINLLLKG